MMDELKHYFARSSQEIDQDVLRLKGHKFTDSEGSLIDQIEKNLQALRVKHEATKQSYKPHLKDF